MSFYRTLLAAVAAAALAAPVFADDVANANVQSPATEGAAVQQLASADQQSMAPATYEKVNLNKATTNDLLKVKGLNASKARAIVSYRKKHGDFKSLDELANVKGFKKLKPETVKEIQDQLTVE